MCRVHCLANRVSDVVRIVADANLTLSAPWGGFNRTYTGVALLGKRDDAVPLLGVCMYGMATRRCCGVLAEPTDPLFVTLGSQFYKILMETYGTDVRSLLRVCVTLWQVLVCVCVCSTSTTPTRTTRWTRRVPTRRFWRRQTKLCSPR